jgi:hypothetical protein
VGRGTLECGEHRRFGYFVFVLRTARQRKIQSGDTRRTPKYPGPRIRLERPLPYPYHQLSLRFE